MPTFADGHAARCGGARALCQVPGPAQLAQQPLGPQGGPAAGVRPRVCLPEPQARPQAVRCLPLVALHLNYRTSLLFSLMVPHQASLAIAIRYGPPTGILFSQQRSLKEPMSACICDHRARAAAEAAGGPEDCHGVPAGSYVVVHVAGVPTAVAAAAVARVAASLQARACGVWRDALVLWGSGLLHAWPFLYSSHLCSKSCA